MTKSGAERQQAYRQRQAEENVRLRELVQQLRAEIAGLKAAPPRPVPENPELARLLAEAREIDRSSNEGLGRWIRQMSDEELGAIFVLLMHTRAPSDDECEPDNDE
jgi:hypothetical protein